MAVQAQHNDVASRTELHDMNTMFLGEPGGGGHLLAAAAQQLAPAVGGTTVFSDLTSKNHNASGCFVARKRARVGDGVLIMDGHGAGGTVVPSVPSAFASTRDAQSRALCSGAASTSGRTAPVSRTLLSHLYRHSVETDALIRVENERLRMGLQEARRRQVRAAVSALETAAARRLRGAEAELERALRRNAELEQKVQQSNAEGQAWLGVARNHEAVAAGLRATLDHILQSPPCAAGVEGEGDAEDAQSCCFVEQEGNADDARVRACRTCGEAEACVLLLPCRHLCLCAGCDAAADACPVCAATKNASLRVLLS